MFCCFKREDNMASSTQHKASKEDKTKIDSFVSALKKKGITLVALDFDQTIIDIHSGGTWHESVDKLVPHVRPCFRFEELVSFLNKILC